MQQAHILTDGKARTNTRDVSVRDARWSVGRRRPSHDRNNPRNCYIVTKQGNGDLVESKEGHWKPSYFIEKDNLKQ